MKTTSVIALLFLFFAIDSHAQKTTVYNNHGYKLTFINYDSTLDSAEQARMVNTFYIVYPELAKAYNPNTLKSVIMVIDTTYKGVAETDNGKVTISNVWMHKHPEDLDVITHEVMHIVQDYGGDSNGPGWLTEGIADYARYKFGINNVAANWKLPDYKPTQNYTDAYRVTARFLVWIEKTYNANTVKSLDEQMRKHTYTDASWQQLTGKSLDDLWKTYITNPVI